MPSTSTPAGVAAACQTFWNRTFPTWRHGTGAIILIHTLVHVYCQGEKDNKDGAAYDSVIISFLAAQSKRSIFWPFLLTKQFHPQNCCSLNIFYNTFYVNWGKKCHIIGWLDNCINVHIKVDSECTPAAILDTSSTDSALLFGQSTVFIPLNKVCTLSARTHFDFIWRMGPGYTI